MTKGWLQGVVSDTCAITPLLWRHHHGHLAAFHARMLLDFRDWIEIAFDAHQHIHAELLVRKLAAAEAHRDLHLVAFVDEVSHAAHLDVVIVIVDAGAKLDLFDLDHLLLLARLVLALLLLVFEFAEIEDFADRRIGVGRHFDEVEPGLDGAGDGIAARDDAHHLAAFVDETHARREDFFVDARPIRRASGWRRLCWPGDSMPPWFVAYATAAPEGTVASPFNLATASPSARIS